MACSFNMFPVVLVPPLTVFIFCFLNYTAVIGSGSRKKNFIYSRSVLVYYLICVVLLCYVYSIVMSQYYQVINVPTSFFFISTLTVFHTVIYCMVLGGPVLMYPIMGIIMALSLPMWMCSNFFIYFLSTEFITCLLGFLFITQDRGKSLNSALINLVIYNFTSTILLLMCLCFLFSYYGTTNFRYITVLVDNTYSSRILYLFIVLSVFVKMGQFPFLVYRFGIYYGFSPAQVGFYASIYSNFLLIPSITTIKFILVGISWFPVNQVLIFFYFITLYTSLVCTSRSDFLVLSTSLTTTLFFIL